jgi:hypothetical protein
MAYGVLLGGGQLCHRAPFADQPEDWIVAETSVTYRPVCDRALARTLKKVNLTPGRPADDSDNRSIARLPFPARNIYQFFQHSIPAFFISLVRSNISCGMNPGPTIQRINLDA